MHKSSYRRSKKTGMPPGSPIYVGAKHAQNTTISIISYDENNFTIIEPATLDDCLAAKNTPQATWINISGLSDTKSITELCQKCAIHPLAIEDIFNTQERPKIDSFHDYIFLTLRSYNYNREQATFASEQISLILGANFVFTIQESNNNTFALIRDRLQAAHNVIRSRGTDYLAYMLIDIVVDGYFTIAEEIGDKIEDLEEKIATNPNNELIREMHGVKIELIYLRKAIWPLREVISGLQNHAGNLIKTETLLYFKDVYEHTVQTIDTVETYRDLLASILDIYLSSVNNKLSEVMKVLTVFASLFIPLTFVTGIYGMNFKFMPELEWRYGYLFVWIILIMAAASTLYFFKRKKWW